MNENTCRRGQHQPNMFSCETVSQRGDMGEGVSFQLPSTQKPWTATAGTLGLVAWG